MYWTFKYDVANPPGRRGVFLSYMQKRSPAKIQLSDGVFFWWKCFGDANLARLSQRSESRARAKACSKLIRSFGSS
jgi:hypothetical protein